MFYLEIGLGEIQKSKENPKRNTTLKKTQSAQAGTELTQ